MLRQRKKTRTRKFSGHLYNEAEENKLQAMVAGVEKKRNTIEGFDTKIIFFEKTGSDGKVTLE